MVRTPVCRRSGVRTKNVERGLSSSSKSLNGFQRVNAFIIELLFVVLLTDSGLALRPWPPSQPTGQPVCAFGLHREQAQGRQCMSLLPPCRGLCQSKLDSQTSRQKICTKGRGRKLARKPNAPRLAGLTV